MKLAVAMPTKEYMPAACAADLAELYAFTQRVMGTASCTLALIQATYVHDGREQLLEHVIDGWGATHVLWLDSDMRFPRDTAERLLSHHLAVIGCNCTTRVPPIRPTSIRDGSLVYTDAQSTGVVEVDGLGFGVLLMQTDIVKALPRPWFRYGWNAGRRSTIGEDVDFCRRLREAGHRLYIDQDLSKEIGHIGTFTFRHEQVPAETCV